MNTNQSTEESQSSKSSSSQSSGESHKPKINTTDAHSPSESEAKNEPLSSASSSSAVLNQFSVQGAAASDVPSAIDLLGFEPYVAAMSDFLLDGKTSPPLTVSIEGAWGSGKSSFMIQLADELQYDKNQLGPKPTAKEKRAKRRKDHLVIQFNPWRHEKDETLWAAFALHFANSLAKSLPWYKRIIPSFQLNWLRFHWMEGWWPLAQFLSSLVIGVCLLLSAWLYADTNRDLDNLLSTEKPKTESIINLINSLVQTITTVLGPWATTLVVMFIFIWHVKGLFRNPLDVNLRQHLKTPDYNSRVVFIEDFHEDFHRVLQTYGAKFKKIFVFIDDLDRCESSTSANVMQAINLMIADSSTEVGRNSKLVFIIGMDREKVAASIAVKNESLLPYLTSNRGNESEVESVGIEYGYRYLEKFVQLPFQMPKPINSLDKLLFHLANPVDSSNHEETAPAERNKGKSLLQFDLAPESDKVIEICRMVAPVLEANPRKLKQFVNIFRLRAIIGFYTGIFTDTATNSTNSLGITLPQLGKFIAISLQWPILILDLEDYPGLLADLEESATKPDTYNARHEGPRYEKLWEIWKQRSDLMNFLEYKVEELPEYSFQKADIKRLLQIAPRVQNRLNSSDLSLVNAPSSK